MTSSRLNLSLDKSFLSLGGVEEKFDPKDYILPETTERDIEIFKEIFDTMDTENDGILKPFDFRKAFVHFNYNIPKKLVYQIISDFDGDESGVIEFREFVNMMVKFPCKSDSDDDIRRTFEAIAKKNKQFITKEDIKNFVTKLNKDTNMNEEFNEENWERIFQEIAGEKDKIDWKTFLDFNRTFLRYLK